MNSLEEALKASVSFSASSVVSLLKINFVSFDDTTPKLYLSLTMLMYEKTIDKKQMSATGRQYNFG